jgi:hypothetical protein
MASNAVLTIKYQASHTVTSWNQLISLFFIVCVFNVHQRYKIFNTYNIETKKIAPKDYLFFHWV